MGQRPGLIIKSGAGTGTQIQNLRDLGPGDFASSLIRDNFNPGQKSGTRTGTRNSKIRDPGLGFRFVGRGIPGFNYSGLSQGLRKSGTRSPGLKNLRDTVPVPCRPLVNTVWYAEYG